MFLGCLRVTTPNSKVQKAALTTEVLAFSESNVICDMQPAWELSLTEEQHESGRKSGVGRWLFRHSGKTTGTKYSANIGQKGMKLTYNTMLSVYSDTLSQFVHRYAVHCARLITEFRYHA